MEIENKQKRTKLNNFLLTVYILINIFIPLGVLSFFEVKGYIKSDYANIYSYFFLIASVISVITWNKKFPKQTKKAVFNIALALINLLMIVILSGLFDFVNAIFRFSVVIILINLFASIAIFIKSFQHIPLHARVEVVNSKENKKKRITVKQIFIWFLLIIVFGSWFVVLKDYAIPGVVNINKKINNIFHSSYNFNVWEYLYYFLTIGISVYFMLKESEEKYQDQVRNSPTYYDMTGRSGGHKLN